MVRVTRSARIRAAPDRIWGLVANLEGWPRWLDAPYATESVKLTAPGQPGPGSEFVLKGRLAFRLFARVIEWEEERSLRFEIFRSEYPSDRAFLQRAVAGFTLEQLDEATTRVTYDHATEGKGFLGRIYMATVFRLFLRANARRVLVSLQRALAH